MILIWLPNGCLLNTLNIKFGFWCFHHSSLSFSYSSLKNGGFHRATTCLDVFSDFVFITQFLLKWVMSYRNWEQVLSVFELWSVACR